MRLLHFERRHEAVLSPRRFAGRMARAGLAWCAITAAGLALGMAGYMATEGMSATDAYVNAAMILSGMGPLGELKTTSGKIFAGSYAILSGLVVVLAAGFVLAPLAHRMLHRFHIEEGRARD